MTKKINLRNTETETIVVNNNCIIRISNDEGKIVLGGIGWIELFDHEENKHGKPLSILEAINKGVKIEKLNEEESKIVKGLFKLL